jgi:hypothetical protein
MKTAILILALLVSGYTFGQQMSGPLAGTTPESRKAYVAHYCKTHPRSLSCRVVSRSGSGE